MAVQRMVQTVGLQRHRDWQSRLAAFVQSRERAPFEWGSHDCALFVCNAIEAISGHNPAADVRGYKTERGAARVVKQLGGMRSIGGSRFGAEIHPMQAQVGDVGLIEVEGRESFALCGGVVWLAPGLNGLERLGINVAVMAWRCF